MSTQNTIENAALVAARQARLLRGLLPKMNDQTICRHCGEPREMHSENGVCTAGGIYDENHRFAPKLGPVQKPQSIVWAGEMDSLRQQLAEKDALLVDALRLLDLAAGVIDGLAGQQAMDDPWYVDPLAEVRAVLARGKEGK